jgi:hypothetical protein
VQPAGSLDQEAVWQNPTHTPTSPFFERNSKRRKGFPSETQVKKGLRIVHGDKELLEKLGRNDPCPCGSLRNTAACAPAAFDGSDRHYFFPRIAARLMRLRRGDCAHPRLARARRRLPSWWAGSDHLRRPHVASGLPPMIPRGSRALRCGRHRSIATISSRFLTYHAARQQ